MRVVYGSFVNSARPLLIAASAVVVCSVNYLDSSAAWPQTVQAKKSSTRPSVYINSVYSNRFPSSQKSDCAPANTTCMQQGNSGPVPDAVKSGYASELRALGLTVVESKPSKGVFFELSLSVAFDELPSMKPIVPKRYTCNLEGEVVRKGVAANRNKIMINERVQALDLGTFSGDERVADRMLVLNCLKHSAQSVRKSIEAMTKS